MGHQRCTSSKRPNERFRKKNNKSRKEPVQQKEMGVMKKVAAAMCNFRGKSRAARMRMAMATGTQPPPTPLGAPLWSPPPQADVHRGGIPSRASRLLGGFGQRGTGVLTLRGKMDPLLSDTSCGGPFAVSPKESPPPTM